MMMDGQHLPHFSTADLPLYDTSLWNLESAFYNRLLECQPKEGEKPTLHLIPYDSASTLLAMDRNASHAHADRWKAHLRSTAAWRKCGGCKHLMVLTRGVTDYPTVRYPDLALTPGSGFLIDDPFWARVSKLVVDAGDNRGTQLDSVYPVPWPSALHPRSAAEVREWQHRVAGTQRPFLISLVASFRWGRATILDACKAHADCHFVSATKSHPRSSHAPGREAGSRAFSRELVYSTYLRSSYCLMPRGDNPSRSGIVDALVCGCIPILADDNPDGLHYPWYLNTSAAAFFVKYGGSAGPRLATWLHHAPSASRFVTDVLTRNHPSPMDMISAAVRTRPRGAAELQRAYIISLLPRLVYSMPAAEGSMARGSALRAGGAMDAVTTALQHVSYLSEQRLGSTTQIHTEARSRSGRRGTAAGGERQTGSSQVEAVEV